MHNEPNAVIESVNYVGLTIDFPDAHHVLDGAIALLDGNLVINQSGTDPTCMLTGQLNLMSHSFQVNGGMVIYNGATAVAPGNLSLTNADLTGDGVIGAQVNVSNGVIAPGGIAGDPTGSLTVDAGLTQSGACEIEIDLDGTASDAYDQLHVTGALSYAGPLTVLLVPGYDPAPGDSFEVLTFGTRSGTIDPVTLPDCVPGRPIRAEFEPNRLLVGVYDLFADLNCDCAVGFDDLNLLLANYNAPSGMSYGDGDLDGDGDVDFDDLNLLLSVYGATCS